MEKIELLSPAGSLSALKQAVYNGADSVYLGIKKFNARNNIEGFSLENLKEAVDFAHLNNVKVFLAINILFKDEELLDAVNTIVEANNLGVDAFIIQDLGLCSIIHKLYPNIIMHASTQLAVHNLDGVKEAEKLGFKRVVLSREISLTEIKKIRENSNMELEVFAHGALCVSFSGNCYMCSHLKNKSGNRGECLQFCRLKYKLLDKNKVLKDGYLLSAKDICTLDYLNTLKEIGVSCIKIEGRARRDYYVAIATKVYRKALDNETLSQKELIDLQLAFNRGFVPAYFNGNNDIISHLQGHMGLQIGKVNKIVKGKNFNELFIETNYQLQPNSVLKFWGDNNNQTSISAMDVKKSGSLYRITTTNNQIKVNDKVNILADDTRENELLKKSYKLPIQIYIEAIEGKEFCAKTVVNDTEFHFTGGVVEGAKNAPLTINDFKNSFIKSETFDAQVFGEIKNAFMTKSAINQLRRDFYNSLEEYMLYCYNTKNNINNLNKIDALPEIKKHTKRHGNIAVIDTVSQVDKLSTKLLDTVILDPEIYEINYIEKILKSIDCKNIYLNLPNFATSEEVVILKEIVNKLKVGVVANNLYALSFDCEKIAGGFLNIYNSYTINFLQEKGINVFYIKELNESESKSISQKTGAMAIEDKKQYMTLRHCPIKHFIGGDCSKCKYKNGLVYKMEDGTKFKLTRKKVSTCTFYLEDV